MEISKCAKPEILLGEDRSPVRGGFLDKSPHQLRQQSVGLSLNILNSQTSFENWMSDFVLRDRVQPASSLRTRPEECCIGAV